MGRTAVKRKQDKNSQQSAGKEVAKVRKCDGKSDRSTRSVTNGDRSRPVVKESSKQNELKMSKKGKSIPDKIKNPIRRVIVKKGANNNAQPCKDKTKITKSPKSPGFSELVQRHQKKKQVEAAMNKQIAADPMPGCSSVDDAEDLDEFAQPLDYNHLDLDGMEYTINPDDDNFDSEIESESEGEIHDSEDESQVQESDEVQNTAEICPGPDNMNQKKADPNPVAKVKELEKDPAVQEYINSLVNERYNKNSPIRG